MAIILGDDNSKTVSYYSVVTNPHTIFYVSNSVGSNSFDGLFPIPNTPSPGNGPFQTLQKAYLAITSGTADWVLLRRGDTWRNEEFANWPTDSSASFNKHGDIAGQNPMVFSNYDPAIAVNGSTGAGVDPAASALARPIVSAACNRGAWAAAGEGGLAGDWCVHIGINFTQLYADPNDAQFGMVFNEQHGIAPTVTNAGSGYNVNDIITLQNTNGTVFTKPQILVTSIGGGGVITGIYSLDKSGGVTNDGVFHGFSRIDGGNLPTAWTQSSVSPSGGTGFTMSADDPQSYSYSTGAAIFRLNSISFGLAENCYFRCNENATDMGGSFTAPQVAGTNMYLRRNVSDSQHEVGWGPHAQGIHGGGCTPWIVDGCVMYHNGWCVNSPGDNTANQFNHNWYMDGVEVSGDINFWSGPETVKNSMSSLGAGVGQFRAGGQYTNNAFVAEPVTFILTNPGEMSNYLIQNNVFLEGLTNGHDGTGIFEMGGPLYTFDSSGSTTPTGQVSVTNNIACNSVDAVGEGMKGGGPEHNVTIDNNIIYNWCPTDLDVSTCITPNQGGILSFKNISGGSGYTPLSGTITGIRYITVTEDFTCGTIPGWTNYVAITISGGTNPNTTPFFSGQGVCYIEGITGSIGASLNGKFFPYGNSFGQTEIVLLGVTNITGAYTSGGSVRLCYPKISLTGGSGSGASASIIVNGAGHIAALSMMSISAGGNSDTPDSGSNYVVNDTISASVPGGSGWSAQVNAVTSNTVGSNNIKDPKATNPGRFPFPTRTSGSYYIAIGRPGGFAGTRDGFFQAVLANNKVGFNALLTAQSLNDYIRQGFGVPMLGSAYADTQGGVTPGRVWASFHEYFAPNVINLG